MKQSLHFTKKGAQFTADSDQYFSIIYLPGFIDGRIWIRVDWILLTISAFPALYSKMGLDALKEDDYADLDTDNALAKVKAPFRPPRFRAYCQHIWTRVSEARALPESLKTPTRVSRGPRLIYQLYKVGWCLKMFLSRIVRMSSTFYTSSTFTRIKRWKDVLKE